MAKKSGITIKISGFEEILTEIQKAGGSIDKAVDSALRQSAQIVQSELKSQMQNAGVDGNLVNAMPNFEVEQDGNQHVAYVGYKKGTYDPKNPSDGYKVVFLNYGTPHRKKHGKMVAKGFIQKAKKKARPQVKKEQQKAFDKILGRLKDEKETD